MAINDRHVSTTGEELIALVMKAESTREIMLDALYAILNIEGACWAADDSWNVEWHFDKVRAAIAEAEGGPDARGLR